MPALLITLSDIQKKHQISDAIKLDKFNEIVFQSQIQDLKPLLGSKLFYELTNDPLTHTTILNAFNGEIDGNEYNHRGLIEVLGYFVYGRLVMFGSAINNPFGFTKKLNKESEQLTYQEKKAIWNEMKDIAFNLWVEVRDFMIETDYEGFKVYDSKPTRGGGLRINKIG